MQCAAHPNVETELSCGKCGKAICARCLVHGPVGARTTGRVDAGDAPLRHAAAGVALATVVQAGLFAVDRATDFTFFTYGDTIEELRDYIVENWRNARIDEGVVHRTREALRNAPGTRPRVREEVRLTRLRPLVPDARV